MTPVTRNCEFCNEPFQPTPGPMAGKQRFCSTKHRVYASRKGLSTKLRVTDDKPKATTEAAAIDWNTLPGNMKDKSEVMRRQIRRELERELTSQADQYRAECDANVAAYKATFDAQNARFKALRDEERRRYQEGIEVYRAKGLITPNEYALIRSCLHPDSRASVSDEKLASAFRVFNDSRIKTLLVKEKG
jgi:hypothetical protein